MEFKIKGFKSDYEKELKEIINEVKGYYPSFDGKQKKLIQKAFYFAEDQHRGQKRASGEDYFNHPIAATKILLQIKPDIETIIACLMHDVIEDTPATAKDIHLIFGDKITFLCEGVEKVAKVRINKNDSASGKIENAQKLFMAMAQDIRVIFIKLSDRIHNLSTIESLRKDKQERITRESLEVYASVADKLALFEFKEIIENLCFKILHPQDYEKIINDLNVSRNKREKFVKDSKNDILELFKKEKFKIEFIDSRKKNLYSIFKKMSRKRIDNINDIFDFLGIRIIVKNPEDCYRALGIIHSRWKPILHRFKDYIALPKPNGYQSLHTTVLGLSQNILPTEIQIRTRIMHNDSELGPASHWAYKKSGISNFDEEYVKKTSWVPREIFREGQFNKSSVEFFKGFSQKILAKRIYVFTPNGDVKFFPEGSTPVDFAYSIHTKIGHCCTKVIINGEIKPLNYELKNGDVVNIITQSNKTPNRDWLNFVKTSKANNKIKLELGKEGIKFNIKKKEKIKITKDKEKFLEKIIKDKFPELSLIIGGEMNLSYKIASCCEPNIKSDKITAYKTLNKDFSIHKDNCKEIDNLDIDRFFSAEYLIMKNLKIEVNNKQGVFSKISGIINENGTDIYNFKSVNNNMKNNSVIIDINIFLKSKNEYENLLNKIRKNNYFIAFN